MAIRLKITAIFLTVQKCFYIGIGDLKCQETVRYIFKHSIFILEKIKNNEILIETGNLQRVGSNKYHISPLHMR